MRFLLIGANGQVGWELKHSLAPLGEVVALYRRDLDMTDAGKIRECVARVAPDVIVNAAAYTAVDKAEDNIDLLKSSVSAIIPPPTSRGFLATLHPICGRDVHAPLGVVAVRISEHQRR